MDPVTMALVAGLASGGAGAIGAWLAGSADAEERRQRMAALQQYAAIAPPEHRELVAREVARSNLSDVRRDAGLEATQDEVLAGLMDVARDGESARGAADYEQSAMDSAQLARSQRMSAVAQAEAQGLGPEAAFTDLLLAGQMDADRERMAGLQRAAYGEEARMGALGQAGSMAASRSATRWGQDAEVARAQDELDMFNAGQWNQMQRYNDEGRYNAFEAQLARADRMANQRGQVADMYERRAGRTREQVGNVIDGAGRAIMAPSTYGAPAPKPTMAPKPAGYQPKPMADYRGATQPAMEQQRQIQTGTPTATALRRRAR